MTSNAAHVALASVILSLMFTAALSEYYDFGMSSLGFANETIDEDSNEKVEFVYNTTYGYSETGCSAGFELAVSPSLAFVKLAKAFSSSYLKCYVGAKHEANASAPLMSEKERKNKTFVLEKLNEQVFHWYRNGTQLGRVNISYWINANSDAMLQLAYDVFYENDGFVAYPTSQVGLAHACCMRVTSSDFSSSSTPPSPSYPLFPLVNLGRHDVIIKGDEYAGVPYFVFVGEKYRSDDSTCPDHLKHAVFLSEIDMEFVCWVSVSYNESAPLEEPDDPNDVALKRARLHWTFDGHDVGAVPDELWKNAQEPTDSLDQLLLAYVYTDGRKLFSGNEGFKKYPCCMDLELMTTSTVSTSTTTSTTALAKETTSTTTSARATEPTIYNSTTTPTAAASFSFLSSLPSSLILLIVYSFLY